jgi:hypothetical protein
MNDESDTPALSEDKRVISEYFASPAFQQSKRRRVAGRERQWVLDRFVTLDRDLVPTKSFCWGLFGLNTIFLLLGFAIPLLADALEIYLGRSRGAVQLVATATLVIPLVTGFSIATVTPMFWYGSIPFRAVVAALMVFPGCLSLYGSMTLFNSFRGNAGFQFSVGLLALFLTTAAVALAIQMWSPWTLTHQRPAEAAIPPLGTRSMMELTGIAAIACAGLMFIDTGIVLKELLFFCGVGILSSLTVITFLIAFLRPGHRNYVAAIAALLLSYLTSFVATGFFEANDLGWQIDNYNFALIAQVSVIGVVLGGAVSWTGVWWLRSCGWLCISREEEKQRK